MAEKSKPVQSIALADNQMVLPSLGQSQLTLEAAAQEVRSAQKAYQAAATRLQTAEESMTNAMVAFNASLTAVKMATRITPLNAQ